MNLLISTCLLGIACTWDGTTGSPWQDGYSSLIPAAQAAGICFVPVCPEQVGGLPTPRSPAELQAPAQEILAGAGLILNREGRDVTPQFLAGAHITLTLARLFNVRLAVLKSRSPSCGVGQVYSGRFDRQLVSGNGLTVSLLEKHGIKTLSDQDFLAEWHRVQGFSFIERL